MKSFVLMMVITNSNTGVVEKTPWMGFKDQASCEQKKEAFDNSGPESIFRKGIRFKIKNVCEERND